jgi:hypothetical protein
LESLMASLKAPFPYFGGKSKVGPLIWDRFGRVANYVEPFFGSGAVLLGCPEPGHTETVNDADGLLSNFWRALRADPDAVAYHADYPVNEIDLHSRHRWLVKQRADVERLLDDPDYFDAKVAGWWVWGISQWIGSGWCAGRASVKMPSLRAPNYGNGSGGQGVHADRLHTKSFGQLPHVGNAGRGGHRAPAKSYGQLPSIGATGFGESGEKGVHLQSNLQSYFHALAARLRRVRVTCGDFERVLGPSVTWRHGVSAIMLDPPYFLGDRAAVYATEDGSAAQRARKWAIENGNNPMLRIALCGYSLEMPETWVCHRWKAAGGYGSQGEGRGRENASKEEIWFSPHCIHKTPLELWADEQEIA